MRALLILNKNSRRGAREADTVLSALSDAGIVCESDQSAQDVEAVLAAGGDGTVTSAIPPALARKVPLGIIPLGTFNDLARTLEIPLNVHQACAAIAAGRKRRIDVGRVNGVYFVNEASVGLSTRIARRQTPQIKQEFGLLAILSTSLQSLHQTRPFNVELQANGKLESFRTVQLTIANSARFGGVFERSDAAVDDGFLDLYSIEVTNWLEAFVTVGKIIRRDSTSGQGLRSRRSTRFVVRTRHAHHIAADGEAAGTTPATFEVLPSCLDVFVG